MGIAECYSMDAAAWNPNQHPKQIEHANYFHFPLICDPAVLRFSFRITIPLIYAITFGKEIYRDLRALPRAAVAGS